MSERLYANARASAARYNSDPCGKTACVSKFGMPYVFICQERARHRGNCHDIDNGSWFEPDSA